MGQPGRGLLTFRVDAGTQTGSGHLMRCLALAQAWKDSGGRVTFITACQSKGWLQRLRGEGFDLILLTHPYPDPGDWECTKNFLATQPDAWLVLDGYNFDEAYQRKIKDGGHRLMVIDDMAQLKHYYADIVLNQNLGAEQLKYSCGSRTLLLLGARYALIRREFLVWRGWKREITDVARSILVTLGGSDTENQTFKIIQALPQANIPGLEATVVIGASNPHIDVLKTAAVRSPVPVRLITDALTMPELMAQADIAISAGGSTCWELAFMGLPNIVLVLSDNQVGIARELAAAGVAIDMGWSAEVTSNAISQSLSHIAQTPETRREMSHRGQQLIDGGGSKMVIELLKGKGGLPGVSNKGGEVK